MFSRSVRALLAALPMAAAISAGASGCGPDSKARVAAFKAGTLTTKAATEIRRGMNFGDAMDAPTEGEWGITLDASDFRAVKEAGFDHVRVPMRFSAHADPSAPYRVHGRFFSRVDWVVDQALSNDLAVIIDVHHYQEMMKSPERHQNRLVGIWRQIAERYKGMPASVIFEVLNEPTENLTAERWNPILALVVETIRAIDPTRTIIIEGAHWASAKDLRDTLFVPPGDPNIIGSFHMYTPMLFTHQGLGWMPPEYATRGVVFPGPPATPIEPARATLAHGESREWFAGYNTLPREKNPSGPAPIIEVMEMAQAFKDRTGLRVYLGEFGATINADVQSRANWTRFVREECERRGFGWGYWDFAHNFAAYSKLAGRWVPELKAALVE